MERREFFGIGITERFERFKRLFEGTHAEQSERLVELFSESDDVDAVLRSRLQHFKNFDRLCLAFNLKQV